MIIENRLVKYPDGSKARRANCPYCLNDGYVELAGSVRFRGVTYERGVTACRWCQEGVDRFNGAGIDWMGHTLEGNYSEEDLAYPPGPPGEGSIRSGVVQRVGLATLAAAIGRKMPV